MYKLIALDMDGTLLNSEKQISDRNKSAIAAARAAGVNVVLASGRPVAGMESYLQQLGMCGSEDYVISFNGALVQSVTDGRVIRSGALTGIEAAQMQELARELGVNIHAFSQQHGLITPKVSYYTELEGRLNQLPIIELDFTTLADDEAILKVMFIDEPHVLDAAVAALPESLSEQYTVVRSAPYFLEIMHQSSHKGAGVAALADHLGLNAAQVICMGDAGNDLHMLEYAGLSVAMANATEEAKAAADYVTASNNEDGVALAIERFVLAQ